MTCPNCRCLLVARSPVASRGLVCADCGHPLPRAGEASTPARVLSLACTGGLLVLAGAISLTMALLEDRQLRPEAPAAEVSAAPAQPVAGRDSG